MRITIFEELVHSVSYDGGIELLFEPYKTKALHYLKKMDLEKFSLYQYETLAKGLFDDEINFTDYGQARDYFAEKLLQDTYIVGINGNDTRLDEKRKYRYVDGG